MQWRRRRKIGGWCLLTRWQNQRNNFSKIFSFLWMILEAMVMNMMKISALRPLCGPPEPVGEDEAEGEGHHRHHRFSHWWPSWCWRWHCIMRTMIKRYDLAKDVSSSVYRFMLCICVCMSIFPLYFHLYLCTLMSVFPLYFHLYLCTCMSVFPLYFQLGRFSSLWGHGRK